MEYQQIVIEKDQPTDDKQVELLSTRQIDSERTKLKPNLSEESAMLKSVLQKKFLKLSKEDSFSGTLASRLSLESRNSYRKPAFGRANASMDASQNWRKLRALRHAINFADQ